ncbi:unnamed protein product [Adineta ricciae]|uniref:Transmembrane protein n=1 Tax=Adineta ricciae TaxID=249248 RepID=A0A815NR84_ADIRI|nr:unnamed protein product [Adineta ricciae]
MGFKERFPRWLIIIFAVVQLVLTLAIIGTELGSFYSNVAHGTIWAGFWSALFYIPTCVLLFVMICCCRGRCYATYVLVLQGKISKSNQNFTFYIDFVALCLLTSVAVIYFAVYFQDNLCKCYLGDNLCCALRDMKSFNQDYDQIANECSPVTVNGVQTVVDPCSSSPPTAKLPYLRAQIGFAGAMIITCIVYAVVYIFAMFAICFGH